MSTWRRKRTDNGGMTLEGPTDAGTTRHRILQIALSLMSQRGVDGTSMRDLASASGLNVASLYHYFPSKRDLLEAVLVEHGYFPVRARPPKPDEDTSAESQLAVLLTNILESMFEVEDFVRLMTGEAMRGEVTARATGLDLFTTFHSTIEEWIVRHRPDLDQRSGAAAVSRLLCEMVVGIFVMRAAGVISEDEGELTDMVARRASEAAQILGV
jgi:AcrR family transcriptional regulator